MSVSPTFVMPVGAVRAVPTVDAIPNSLMLDVTHACPNVVSAADPDATSVAVADCTTAEEPAAARPIASPTPITHAVAESDVANVSVMALGDDGVAWLAMKK